MTTEKQRIANPRNALKSTGPRTKEGLERASKNALKHGLRSTRVVLDDESTEEFEALLDDLEQDLKPHGALQRQLVVEIASTFWRLRRCTTIETALFRQEEHYARSADEEEAVDDGKGVALEFLEAAVLEAGRIARTQAREAKSQVPPEAELEWKIFERVADKLYEAAGALVPTGKEKATAPAVAEPSHVGAAFHTLSGEGDPLIVLSRYETALTRKLAMLMRQYEMLQARRTIVAT